MTKSPVLASLALFALLLAPARAQSVSVHWLDPQPPARDTGVSFGVPWPEGALRPGASFTLAAGGRSLPLQAWPLAYWPDGSLKWTGLATVAPAGFQGEATVSAGSPAAEGGLVRVERQADAVVVDTGALTCTMPLRGPVLIASLRIGGREVARNGRLVCLLQNGPSAEGQGQPAAERFTGVVERVTVEQDGPVRAVIKIDGRHQASGRAWLPFSVRLYFYSGRASVRMVHTITFDGDQEKDFIRGLGLVFDVPLREQARYRQVRFAGEKGGVWSEPLQPAGGDWNQEEGKDFNPRPDFYQNAIWDDFKLVQPNPDGFTVVKRTNPKSTWLFSAAGNRAGGLVFVGDRQGGLGISIRHFWQSYPESLEVRHANSPEAEIEAWLWSPDGPAMDMRHYDTHAHGLLASYEDVQPGLSTAYGVARTSELTLFPAAALPSRAETGVWADEGKVLPLLVATPEYIHSTGVFGVWSLKDRSTPFLRSIEDGLDSVLAFYERQVDERDWYGFWQFGDFMHSYSLPRHDWHYDWGGHAWDNTELGAPLWMWYSFLRSGRADLFRLAEAHTRDTSETNVYHLGPMMGLGTRHNVIKWGDGAKEMRISQAAHWRIFYYLTTDERTGDIMHMMIHSDAAALRYDPMREAEPPVPGEPKVPARLRIGPDWFALAGNWMTEWERTGDTRWRDRILAGLDSILAMPYWFNTGQANGLNPDLPGGGVGPLHGGGSNTVGYDIKTGRLYPIRDPLTKVPAAVTYNLATIQGGAEVMFELIPLLGRPDIQRAWLQYCRLGQAPADVLTRDRTTGKEGADARYVIFGQSGPRLAAYAYAHTGDRAYAEHAIDGLLNMQGGFVVPRWITGADAMKPVEEAPGLSTNDASQTALQTIETLEFCRNALPTEGLDFSYRLMRFYGGGPGGPPGAGRRRRGSQAGEGGSGGGGPAPAR